MGQRRHGSICRRLPGLDADTDTYSNTHRDADPYSNANADAYSNALADTYSLPNTDALGNAYSLPNAHAHGNADTFTYSNTHRDADTYAYANADTNALTDADVGSGDIHAANHTVRCAQSRHRHHRPDSLDRKSVD